MMHRSDGPMYADGMDRTGSFPSAVKARRGIPHGVDSQRICTDGIGCARLLPCALDAAIPTIPPGLDDQGVLLARYTKDLVCTLLDAMQSQIAHLECAVFAASSDNRPKSHVGACDSEIAPDIHVKCATDYLHQAAPQDTETHIQAVPSRGIQDVPSRGVQNIPSRGSQILAKTGSAFSGTLFFESALRDIETHQIMKLKARIRSCFTSNAKPLMLSPLQLSNVLHRRGLNEDSYDLSILANVLSTMDSVFHLVFPEDQQPEPTPAAGTWMRAIQNNMMVATLTVSKRQARNRRASDRSMHDIIDLDIFIKLLVSPDLVHVVESYSDNTIITLCIKDIQRILFSEEAIDETIDRLASAESSSVDWAHTCRTSDYLEFLTVIISLVAYVLEVDNNNDWMGWGVIELACTSALTLLIVWKVFAQSLKSYLCGEMWKWNLIDSCCTAVAIGALLARLVVGGFYSVRLMIAIRLLRGFRMRTFLYLVPCLYEASVMLAGFVIGLPYLFCAVFLMLVATLIMGVMTKLAVGPPVGQDLTKQCGTGDDYFRSGHHSDECPLVSLYSEEFLDSVANSVITTFRCMTGSCTSKAGVSLDLVFSEYYGAGFICAYTAIACTFLFGIANVVTAACFDGIHRDMQARFKHFAPPSHYVHRKLMNLKELVRGIVQVENDLPVNITRGELDIILRDTRVQSILHELDVRLDNGVLAFELLDFDCDEYVKETDFYFMILKMRGSLQKADVVGAWLSLRDQREANNLNHLALLDAQQKLYRQLQCRNAAVMLYRVDRAFEDEIHPSCGAVCIASFPGRHVFEWQGLVQLCKNGKLNSACVYLPKDDPQKRYGRHSNNPATPGSCYCWALYGSLQEWGCKWFTQWIKQVEMAVSFNMELVVVFFEGQKDCGIQDWNKLASTDLWDGIGLGGSQKGEVAWLKQQGYAFTSMDLRKAIERFHLNVSPRKASTSSIGLDQQLSRGIDSGFDCEDWLAQDCEPTLTMPSNYSLRAPSKFSNTTER